MAVQKRSIIRGAAAVLCAAEVAVSPGVRLFCGRMIGQAALIASALAMPDGAVLLLRERYTPDFKPEVSQSTPQNATAASAVEPPLDPPPQASSLPPAGESLPAEVIPDIPAEYRGTLTERTMIGEATGAFCPLEHGWVRNYTELTRAEIRDIAAQPPALTPYAAGPQVLIYHTHATESFEPYDSDCFDTRNTWRSEDDTENVVAVGAALAQTLEKCGVSVLHDTTQHDNPSYGGAYERSAETAARYLAQYPSIRVLLDVHRDAINVSETEIAKVVTTVDGRKAAQLMIIAPCDADGTLGIPSWKENLRFAAGFTDAVEARWPDLTRPVFFCPRSYNYALSPGALLLEFGASGNTLEEAVYTAELIAPILADYLAALE